MDRRGGGEVGHEFGLGAGSGVLGLGEKKETMKRKKRGGLNCRQKLKKKETSSSVTLRGEERDDSQRGLTCYLSRFHPLRIQLIGHRSPIRDVSHLTSRSLSQSLFHSFH